MPNLKPTETDIEIIKCIDEEKSFAVIAGAGSGKTTSLIEALKYIRENKGNKLRQIGQKVVCITYTNRAVGVISSRLDYDELYKVTTLHGFLWGEVARFQAPLRRALIEDVIPKRIAKAQEDDNGGNSKKAIGARIKVERLQFELKNLKRNNPPVKYEETIVSDYSKCILNHDDVIDVASYLILTQPLLQKGLGLKYPYIFVDEAQDTFPQVMDALNSVCAKEGLPLIGYFGDPMQQIYDKRAGDFKGPEGAELLTKGENFRCSVAIIDLLNKFRNDVEQFPAGENYNIKGSVEIIIVGSPEPTGPRKTYTPEQLECVSSLFNNAFEKIGWQDNASVKQLFLTRQMIARRLNFVNLHQVFTGKYSSSRSQSDYEDGTHYLLKPFIETIYPLVSASFKCERRRMIEILRSSSPAFIPNGIHKGETLQNMLNQAKQFCNSLTDLWKTATVKEILKYCKENSLLAFSERLFAQLNRPEREVFDEENEEHNRDKGDWLADAFLKMSCDEIGRYIEFLDEGSPFSTQHGTKGEEYDDVLVMFDDIEAAWNNYSFGKVLTPHTVGSPTERQDALTRKLAYVCFSRARVNLRILLFSSKPKETGKELVEKGLFEEKQISYI